MADKATRRPQRFDRDNPQALKTGMCLQGEGFLWIVDEFDQQGDQSFCTRSSALLRCPVLRSQGAGPGGALG